MSGEGWIGKDLEDLCPIKVYPDQDSHQTSSKHKSTELSYMKLLSIFYWDCNSSYYIYIVCTEKIYCSNGHYGIFYASG
jgi:hypothetical protein